jgi:hypothetical protein
MFNVSAMEMQVFNAALLDEMRIVLNHAGQWSSSSESVVVVLQSQVQSGQWSSSN